MLPEEDRMTVLTLRFYRAVVEDGAVVLHPTGRPAVYFEPVRPAPGMEVRTVGFPPCRCPRAPACHAAEREPLPARRFSPKSAAG
jgi:hypothetical protein